MQPIFWYKTKFGIMTIVDDSDPLFLHHVDKDARGYLNKNFADGLVESGQWELITNPLEAYALQQFNI